jgi:hypothetical protein
MVWKCGGGSSAATGVILIWLQPAANRHALPAFGRKIW